MRRTELIITIGEVLECLPPGKSFRRKRYNSFDANQNAAIEAGNEENVAPPSDTPSCLTDLSGGMRTRDTNGGVVAVDLESEPCFLTIRRKTRGGSEDGLRRQSSALDGDDEITFNMDSAAVLENGHGHGDDADDDDSHDVGGPLAKSKSKRKSSAEKFLEDNVNYFQLEVLPSKTRSTKLANGEDSVGYHNSFLDFLKSKGLEGKEESDEGADSSDRARSRNRHKSGPVGGGGGGVPSARAARPRAASFHHQSPARSDSEDSVVRRPPRARSQFRNNRSLSRARSRSSRQRDVSPSGSESEATKTKKCKSPRKLAAIAVESSDDESEVEQKHTRSRRRAEFSSPSPSKKSRRSELDKLLEAVDTSFHFETAAAAAKRLSGSPNLGPLEIDVSDSNCESESSDMPPAPVKKKRKTSDSDIEPESKAVKKQKASGSDLLKTLSPDSSEKKIFKEEESDSENGEEYQTWDGWDTLNETLAVTNSCPVPVEDLHFSFEATPRSEGWFQTYSRQDAGEDIVYYPETRGFPFALPYEMPLSLFMPYKLEAKEKMTKKQHGAKKPSVLPTNHVAKFKKRKVSDCESTDSSDSSRKGKQKLGAKVDHLLDMQHRVSPRCHASTKATDFGGVMADDELAEAFLYRDERELLFPGMLLPFQCIDETSNDSLCSTRPLKRESVGDYLQLAASVDKFFRQPDDFDLTGARADEQASASGNSGSSKVSKEKTTEKQTTVPTRSRISSEELLKTKKDKQKKKKDKSIMSDLMMDQVVQSQVDDILLDCLEEELPTVPFEGFMPGAELQTILDTYQSCKSMNVCNSRWLRPSRPAVLNDESGSSSSCSVSSSGSFHAKQLGSTKKASLPFKPKRLVIYKEDLPGFKFDNDIELEKLPVSKRCLAKSGAIKENPPAVSEPPVLAEVKKEAPTEKKPDQALPTTPKTMKKKMIKREVFISRKEKKAGVETSPAAKSGRAGGLDDDAASVSSNASSSSRKKGKRKVNKTGFPSAKKKKQSEEGESRASPPTHKKKKKEVEDVKKKPKQSNKSPGDKSTTRQLKMDKFVTKKSVKSPSPTKSSSQNKNNVGKRSTTLQAKNYSELESDTESLLESKVPYRSPHIKSLPLPKKKGAVSSPNKSRSR